MYVKLFSRITESSLMEEPVPVRYAFVMLLAIADPQGYVIGTDVALARRLNLPLEDFTAAVRRLMEPDPHSNSPQEEGRRLLPSDLGNGYRIVNFIAYRNMRDEESRREYQRNYMATYRAEGRDKTRVVNLVNNGKRGEAQLAQAEAEAEAEEKEEEKAEKTLIKTRAAKPSLRSAAASPTSVEESIDAWLLELQKDKAYEGIDVSGEFSKMKRWCEVNHKQATRKRFINWLNRCEKPLIKQNRGNNGQSDGTRF